MKKAFFHTLGVITTFAMSHSIAIAADETPPVAVPEQFSVTMEVAQGEPAETQMEANIIKLGSKQRTDFISARGMDMSGGSSLNMYVIMDLESGKATTVMPSQQMYMEMDMSGASGMGEMTLDKLMEKSKEYTYEELGTEEVNGVKATKYNATNAKGEEMIMWVDPKHKFPVKIQIPNQQLVVNYKDFSDEAPEAGLFEIPENYNSLQGLNPEMLKNMMPPGAAGN